MRESPDIGNLRAAVESGRMEWQRHALERMAERHIPRAAVTAALLKGERIEDYPDAYPLPAALFPGMFGQRPLHVLSAFGEPIPLARLAWGRTSQPTGLDLAGPKHHYA